MATVCNLGRPDRPLRIVLGVGWGLRAFLLVIFTSAVFWALRALQSFSAPSGEPDLATGCSGWSRQYQLSSDRTRKHVTN
jgi:hypothetical protein